LLVRREQVFQHLSRADHPDVSEQLSEMLRAQILLGVLADDLGFEDVIVSDLVRAARR
jgi:hypothetical protein